MLRQSDLLATNWRKTSITNEYLALPAELNLNLNKIYRSGTLLSEAELEALLQKKLTKIPP